ncbi:flagellar hook-basal body complex protein FliE [uncultured Bartonella sp.]|uniref:flagellar hook-basal body complex protein FliE n=1 Tax=uncultured Bartonella sp. TaxID=104108 RepID=UPI00261E40C3|nr:flagellar hook-basal body complex protein FliE [uncultured Bartonella sp.]
MIQSLTSSTTRAALERLGQSQGLTASQTNLLGTQASSQAEGIKNPSFDQVLAEVTGAVGNNLQNAEALSMKKIEGGDVSVRQVVNSVMDAERSLNTAIAIRDKIVQAYLEVSRMQI